MTIAQQLKVKDFPFIIKDNRNNVIYLESSKGYWEKYEYDSMNRVIYNENSDNAWHKFEYDSNGNKIYYEDSTGFIMNNRPKAVTELTMDQIAATFNIPLSQLKIKK